jgi:hypothetical protein
MKEDLLNQKVLVSNRQLVRLAMTAGIAILLHEQETGISFNYLQCSVASLVEEYLEKLTLEEVVEMLTR